MTSKTDKKPTEIKSFEAFVIEAKADDAERGVVEAIVSVFGVIDYGQDRIYNGAFKKTISERGNRVRVLDNHNASSTLKVVGKLLEIREIGKEELPKEVLSRYPSATGGLYTKTQYLLNTPEGKGVFERIKARAIEEYSIGYDVLDYDYEKIDVKGVEVTIRNLRQIRLWEISPVVFAMNDATTTVSAKSDEVIEEPSVESMAPNSLSEEKEMTPDGPNERLGECIVGNVERMFAMLLTSWLSAGFLSIPEYRSLKNLADSTIGAFVEGMPEEIANRQLHREEHYYMASNIEKEAKDLETIEAGPSHETPTERAEEFLVAIKELELALLEI